MESMSPSVFMAAWNVLTKITDTRGISNSPHSSVCSGCSGFTGASGAPAGGLYPNVTGYTNSTLSSGASGRPNGSTLGGKNPSGANLTISVDGATVFSIGGSDTIITTDSSGNTTTTAVPITSASAPASGSMLTGSSQGPSLASQSPGATSAGVLASGSPSSGDTTSSAGQLITSSSSESAQGSSSSSGSQSSASASSSSSSSELSGLASSSSAPSSSAPSNSASSNPASAGQSPSNTVSSTPTTPQTSGSASAPTPSQTKIDPASLTTAFTVSEITVPAQVSSAQGSFTTLTLPSVSGVKNTYSATTITQSNGPVIVPVWWDSEGHGLLVSPLHIEVGGFIKPPKPELPEIVIGEDGKPVEAEDGDDDDDEAESSSTTESTSSSCTQTAVTQEQVSCLTVVASGSTIPVSCTTQDVTITGCDAIGTTSTTVSTSVAGSRNFIIMAQETASPGDRKAFDAELSNELGQDSFKSMEDENNDPVIWLAPLNAKQSEKFQSSSSIVSTIIPDQVLTAVVSDQTNVTKSVATNVAIVTPDPTGASNQARDVLEARRSGSAHPRNTSERDLDPRGLFSWGKSKPKLVRQYNAPDDLKVISQGRTTLNRINYLQHVDYVYDESAGKGITVYVVDSGLNMGHNEIKAKAGQIRWLPYDASFTKNWEVPDDQKNDEPISDTNGHGSCVVSKVLTDKWGVAKNANLVMMKYPMVGEQKTDENGNLMFASNGDPIVDYSSSNGKFTMMLNTIITDVKKRKLKGKAVVNLAWDSPFEGDPETKAALGRLAGRLLDLGVPIVVAGGNDGTVTDLKIPAIWTLYNEKLLYSVGAVDVEGTQAWWSQTNQINLWAPGSLKIRPQGQDGDGVECMGGLGSDATQTKEGTSFATPLVAGLAAYFLGLKNNGLNSSGRDLVRDLLAKLREFSFARDEDGNGPEVVWNVVNGGDPECGSNKRDTDEVCLIQDESEWSTLKTFVSTASSGSNSLGGSSAQSSTLTVTTTTTSPSQDTASSSSSSATSSPSGDIPKASCAAGLPQIPKGEFSSGYESFADFCKDAKGNCLYILLSETNSECRTSPETAISHQWNDYTPPINASLALHDGKFTEISEEACTQALIKIESDCTHQDIGLSTGGWLLLTNGTTSANVSLGLALPGSQ